MTTLKQIYCNQWTLQTRKRLFGKIEEEFEQNFKPLVRKWLQQKRKELPFPENLKNDVIDELLEELNQ